MSTRIWEPGEMAKYIGPVQDYYNTPVEILPPGLKTEPLFQDGRYLGVKPLYNIKAFDGYCGGYRTQWSAEPHELVPLDDFSRGLEDETSKVIETPTPDGVSWC